MPYFTKKKKKNNINTVLAEKWAKINFISDLSSMHFHHWPSGGGITTAATKPVECSQILTVHSHKCLDFSDTLFTV